MAKQTVTLGTEGGCGYFPGLVEEERELTLECSSRCDGQCSTLDVHPTKIHKGMFSVVLACFEQDSTLSVGGCENTLFARDGQDVCERHGSFRD